MPSVTNRQTFKEYCLDNKYTKWYFSIIEKAENRGWNKNTAPVYGEMHHIVPKSIIKNNEVVFLTAKEHFICHMLLPKMLAGPNQYKMIRAAIAISIKNKSTKNRYVNSRSYSKIKEQYSNLKKIEWKSHEYRKYMSEKISETHWDSSGIKNPMYGKKGELSPHYNVPKTEEHKNKIKKALLGKKYSKERCKNMSANCPKNSLGKKWYHNPITKQQKYFIPGQQPDDFILGRGY